MILISSCLVGIRCRYDGTAATRQEAQDLYRRGLAVIACPEVLGGLGIPRTPCEIKMENGEAKVVTKEGLDVTESFRLGAQKTLDICREMGIKHAVLKDRSPSCGAGHIYSGRFDGTVVAGYGLTAALLKENGISVYEESTVSYEKILKE